MNLHTESSLKLKEIISRACFKKKKRDIECI